MAGASGFLGVEITEDTISERLQAIVEVIGQNLQGGVQGVADVMTEALQLSAPVGRHYDFGGGMIPGGRLRDSLRFDVASLGAILFGVDYGRMVISGTGPHTIRPNAAKALAFYWERMGASVVRASVHHPGTRPNDFRLKAIDHAYESGQLQRVLNQVLGATLAGESMAGTG